MSSFSNIMSTLIIFSNCFGFWITCSKPVILVILLLDVFFDKEQPIKIVETDQNIIARLFASWWIDLRIYQNLSLLLISIDHLAIMRKDLNGKFRKSFFLIILIPKIQGYYFLDPCL